MLEGFFTVGVIAFCLAGIAVVGYTGIMAVRTGVIIVNDISMRFVSVH
jgi:hypothetical protein